MVGESWKEDIKFAEEKLEKEKERPEEVDIIDPVIDVWNTFVNFGEMIHRVGVGIQGTEVLSFSSCSTYRNVSLNGKLSY